jgi:hypothetical protein
MRMAVRGASGLIGARTRSETMKAVRVRWLGSDLHRYPAVVAAA